MRQKREMRAGKLGEKQFQKRAVEIVPGEKKKKKKKKPSHENDGLSCREIEDQRHFSERGIRRLRKKNSEKEEVCTG